jgi:short-subunit dehydrogenase
MKNVRGATAILTGASRGIGPYIAKVLAAEGVNLALAARDTTKLNDTRITCEHLGVRAIAVGCDVTSTPDLRRLIETAERELGPIDILVNNAGVEIPGTLWELSDEEADGILETNLHAPIRLTRLVLPGMLERKRGAIVHVSSMAGKSGAPYNAMYSATKFALQGLNESMQFELEGTGVHMGTVCPGFVADAGMWVNRGGAAPRFVQAVSPEKVARAVLKVIRGDLEALVMPGPFRPLLALNTLFPGLQRPLVKRLGVTEAMRGTRGDAPAAGGVSNEAAPEPESADIP